MTIFIGTSIDHPSSMTKKAVHQKKIEPAAGWLVVRGEEVF